LISKAKTMQDLEQLCGKSKRGLSGEESLEQRKEECRRFAQQEAKRRQLREFCDFRNRLRSIAMLMGADKLLLCIGGSTAGTSGRAWKNTASGGPTASLIQWLSRFHLTVLIDEYMTSQCCPGCASQMEKFGRTKSERHKKCTRPARAPGGPTGDPPPTDGPPGAACACFLDDEKTLRVWNKVRVGSEMYSNDIFMHDMSICTICRILPRPLTWRRLSSASSPSALALHSFNEPLCSHGGPKLA